MNGGVSERPGAGVRKAQRADDRWEELSGTLKMFSRTIKVATESRVEIYDVTDRVTDAVQSSGIQNGFLTITSLHTTTALFINEFQAALVADFKQFLERLASRECGYLHNCEDCSDCERKNADAHIRALVLGHHLTLPLQAGRIAFGQWQSILFAELDGPQVRSLMTQVFGV